MGFNDWLKNQNKVSHHTVHSSHDFRKDKPFVEPKIPYLTDIIAIPIIGPLRAYYLLLVAIFFLFLLTKNWLVGLTAGILMLFIVIWEFYAGSKSGGFKNELKETALAILLGLVVWFGSGFLLNTSTPINAIVSCSMLPAYERGDMVILQGAIPNTEYVKYNGNSEEINSIASVQFDGAQYAFNGSVYAYCTQSTQPICISYYSQASNFANAPEQISRYCEEQTENICKTFFLSPQNITESHGPISIQYSTCSKFYPKDGKTVEQPCVAKTYFNGKEIKFNSNYELLVYQPKKTDVYGLIGDIVHRARVGINASDGMVYLTKGDNNPIYDFQFYSDAYKMGNSPVNQGQVKGKVIFRIPLLGNFKLFITPQVLIASDQQTGCDAYFKN